MMKISSRGLAIGLVASLAINLFLAGVLAAGLLLHRHDGRKHFAGPFRHWAERAKLDDQTREKVESIWRDSRPVIRLRVRAVRAARRDLRKQLSADPLDPKSLEQSYANLRIRSQEAQEAIHAAMAKVAATLTPDERKRFFRPRHRRGYRYRRPQSP